MGPGKGSLYGVSLGPGSADTIWHSTDGAASWQPIALPPDYFSPGSPLTLGAAPGFLYLVQQAGTQRLFATSDNGASWQDISSDLPDQALLLALAASPVAPRRLFFTGDVIVACGAMTCADFRLEGSSNNGRTWRGLASLDQLTGSGAQIVTDPISASTLYLLGRPLLESTDGGVTMRPLPLRGQVVSLAIDPASTDVLYAATTQPRPIFKSTDRGTTWGR